MSPSLYSAAAPQLALLLSSATAFLRAGQPAHAIEPLREAALLQPSNAAIQHDLGLACLEAGRLDEAIAAFERASLPLMGEQSSLRGCVLQAWHRQGEARGRPGRDSRLLLRDRAGADDD